MSKQKLNNKLVELAEVLQTLGLWQTTSPTAEALLSTEPFALDYLAAHEWLQWIFIPKMLELIQTNQELPKQIAIIPYLEEAIKDQATAKQIIQVMQEIEQIIVQL